MEIEFVKEMQKKRGCGQGGCERRIEVIVKMQKREKKKSGRVRVGR